MGDTYQSLKAANLVRVSTGKSQHLYAARQNLGESLMCPAGAQHLQNDIYGRPVTQNTIPLNLDASCAQGSMYDTRRYLEVENMARPTLTTCESGLRGVGDLMGKGRDLMPRSLYDGCSRGNFIRTYPTPNNAPFDIASPMMNERCVERPWRQYDFSMDSTKSAYWHG